MIRTSVLNRASALRTLPALAAPTVSAATTRLPANLVAATATKYVTARYITSSCMNAAPSNPPNTNTHTNTMSKLIIPTLLKDRVVVIAGGTGSVGEGIVKSELLAGAKVVVLSRGMDKINELKAWLKSEGTPIDNLLYTIGDYTTFEGARDVISRVTADHGQIDHFVASIGGWWMGKNSWEISQADWDKAYVGLSTAHMAVLRATIPRLPQGGSYTFILGGSARTPVPGSSLVCMEQAGLLMLRSILSLEVGNSRRINSLVLGPVSTRSRGGRVSPDWITGEQAGQICVGIQGGHATGNDFNSRSPADADAAIKLSLSK